MEQLVCLVIRPRVGKGAGSIFLSAPQVFTKPLECLRCRPRHQLSCAPRPVETAFSALICVLRVSWIPGTTGQKFRVSQNSHNGIPICLKEPFGVDLTNIGGSTGDGGVFHNRPKSYGVERNDRSPDGFLHLVVEFRRTSAMLRRYVLFPIGRTF